MLNPHVTIHAIIMLKHFWQTTTHSKGLYTVDRTVRPALTLILKFRFFTICFLPIRHLQDKISDEAGCSLLNQFLSSSKHLRTIRNSPIGFQPYHVKWFRNVQYLHVRMDVLSIDAHFLGMCSDGECIGVHFHAQCWLFSSVPISPLLLSFVRVSILMVTAYRRCRSHGWRFTGLPTSFLQFLLDTSPHFRKFIRPC